MLETEGEFNRFPPSDNFRAQALVSDESIYREAAEDPRGWWEKQAQLLDWFEPWQQTLDDSQAPFYKWFVGGKLNASYNCLDRHIIAGRGDRVAYYWQGEEGEQRTVTYADLYYEVQRLANVLKPQGIKKDDVVGIYLPVIPEAVVAMLACARIGALHNVVFGGFAPQALASRMDVSNAKALITTDGYRRRGQIVKVKDQVDPLLSDLPSLNTVIVVRHTGCDATMKSDRDIWYNEAVENASPDCPAEPLDAEHPLFILYTSGSTARPKGILHTTGGYLTGAAYTHKYVFDLKPETDVYWCTADQGWITGHTYLVYGPLANGATSVMYEGAPDYPHKGIWWEIIERFGVTIFYTAPTALRACMKWGSEYPGSQDLSSLRLLGSVGEPINPKAWLWYHEVIGQGRCPIVDTWWQTETGHIMSTPLPGVTATKPGSVARPLPGISSTIYDEQGNEVTEGTGMLVITQPWPGMLRTLYGEDERYQTTYFGRFGSKVYLAGDIAKRDRDGFLWIVGRMDDVINVSGHRLSTAEIESAIVGHKGVAEAAVIGCNDDNTGQAVVAFVTPVHGFNSDGNAAKDICSQVSDVIGKLARPKHIIWAEDLPKTRSGKIMRRILRNIVEGEELGDTTTIQNKQIIEELQKRWLRETIGSG